MTAVKKTPSPIPVSFEQFRKNPIAAVAFCMLLAVSYLYVDECVEAVLRMMESDFIGPVNIGSEEMVTISAGIEVPFPMYFLPSTVSSIIKFLLGSKPVKESTYMILTSSIKYNLLQ